MIGTRESLEYLFVYRGDDAHDAALARVRAALETRDPGATIDRVDASVCRVRTTCSFSRVFYELDAVFGIGRPRSNDPSSYTPANTVAYADRFRGRLVVRSKCDRFMPNDEAVPPSPVDCDRAARELIYVRLHPAVPFARDAQRAEEARLLDLLVDCNFDLLNGGVRSLWPGISRDVLHKLATLFDENDDETVRFA